ncbi:CBS domain-containing protein [Paraburkholderia kururiensis]|uniref:CBS domain-containing protein n=1 Tax=Paraburkholderia kururiensis TaxID=984307 RepID=UPI0005AB4023|nr:CBS domain-containing protein [Paraburkholderia kururiensis]
MEIREIMTTRVVMVSFDDTLATVKHIFDSAKFHHVLVVEDGELQGVVSDRDLLRALSPFIDSVVEAPRDVATLNRRVHQIMGRRPVTLGPDADVSAAVEIFLEKGVSCIPIVRDGMRPVGIVSWRDVLRALAPRAAQ